MEKIIKTAYKQLNSSLNGIKNGEININPLKFNSKSTSCTYCPYSAVCAFDTDFENNVMKNIKSLSGKEFFEYVTEMD